MKYFAFTISFLMLLNMQIQNARATDPTELDSSSFYNMSLEQLMNLEVSVASLKSLTPRESPGIITVINEEEIRNSGAQDLIDVLRQVPGLQFGVDVEGVVGIGVRGNWVHEGKVMLLIDGQDMNEQLYSTLQFGEHYPVDQIRKIEIIRGPGSSIYGGNAEYAVINIITKVNKDFNGISATASYGQMSRTFASRSISVNGGEKIGGLHLNLGLYAGESNRSQLTYTDYQGTSYDMSNNSRLQNYSVNLNTEYKNLSFRFLGDFYSVQSKDYYVEVIDTAITEKFPSLFFDLKYKWNVSNRISIVPRLQYKQQAPWSVTDTTVMASEVWHVVSQKPCASVTVNYDIRKNMNLVSGAEYFLDMATDKIGNNYFYNGEPSVRFVNADLFSQWLWSNKVANLTVGARLHANDQYDPSIVPRIAITKVVDRAHFKALYSYAFRTPGIENINEGVEGIQPEKTRAAEIEAGYQINDRGYVSVNVFDITTIKPIIYMYDEEETYKNSGETGTRGFELDYKLKGKVGYGDLNYSFYTIEGKKISNSYSACKDNVLLAFPASTINGSFHLTVIKKLVIGATGSIYGRRFSYAGKDAEGNKMFEEHKAQFLCGVNVMTHDVGAKGLSVSLGCFNLFDEKDEFIQPYRGDHNPLPGKSRELRIRVSYNFEKGR